MDEVCNKSEEHDRLLDPLEQRWIWHKMSCGCQKYNDQGNMMKPYYFHRQWKTVTEYLRGWKEDALLSEKPLSTRRLFSSSTFVSRQSKDVFGVHRKHNKQCQGEIQQNLLERWIEKSKSKSPRPMLRFSQASLVSNYFFSTLLSWQFFLYLLTVGCFQWLAII